MISNFNIPGIKKDNEGLFEKYHFTKRFGY